jgi:nucleoside 2-deoxyribosyltransferase
MRIYIAAPWVRREEAIEIAKRFEAEGYEITSRWFKHDGDPNDSTGINCDQDEIRKQATEDWEDVATSDWVVVLNLQKSEGKAVETGLAIASGVPFISVGQRSNIFQSLGVEVETVEEALEYLR